MITLKIILKKLLYYFFPLISWKKFARSQSSNKESDLLVYYTKKYSQNKNFIEFGFHPYQFNCIGLIKDYYNGLLVDGEIENIVQAKRLFYDSNYKVQCEKYFLSRDNLFPIENFARKHNFEIGVLSIDIDGNDYYILKEILKLFFPEIICLEYNASFGKKAITIPYKHNFKRHELHKSGWYHGASYNAFINLLKNDYTIAENIDGLNLIFVRRDKFKNNSKSLLGTNYKEQLQRNSLSKKTAAEQWDEIKDLPFINL